MTCNPTTRACQIPAVVLLLVACVACAPLIIAGESVATPVVSAPTSDLREVLAATASERDYLALRLDQVSTRVGLLVGYGVLMTLLAGWLGVVLLKRPRQVAPASAADSAVETHLGTTVTVRQRKNATITIRNGATQRVEVVENVETRRFFPKTEPRPARVEEVAAAMATADDDLILPDDPAPELRPGTDRSVRAAPDARPEPITSRRPATVRVEHHSDRLPPVEVEVKPGTAAVPRRGFSLLEVMISLAVLATVMASVVGSMYTLHQSRTLALEDSEARMLGGRLSELMMAEWIWNLNQWYPDNNRWHDAYVDDPDDDDQPLDAARLRAEFNNVPTPALNELKIYLEYYRSRALERAIMDDVDINDPGAFFIRANRQNGGDRTMVIRIVITWQSTTMSAGAPARRHTRLLVRSE